MRNTLILLAWLGIAAAFAAKAGAWPVSVCAAIVAIGELVACTCRPKKAAR